jgi:hypothetical protein
MIECYSGISLSSGHVHISDFTFSLQYINLLHCFCIYGLFNIPVRTCDYMALKNKIISEYKSEEI